jgi:glycyl-tRNA synthetase beta chain
MSTQNLLVELFVEELPPKALKKLGEAFGGVLLEQLKAQGLAGADSASRRWRLKRLTRLFRKS